MEQLETIRSYWNTRADGYSKSVMEEMEDAQKEGTYWKTLLDKYLPKADNPKVLDLGCGPGFFTMMLGQRGCQMTAFDYSDGMLNQAKQNAASAGVTAEFVQGDAQKLPFEDETFDMIVTRNLTWNINNVARDLPLSREKRPQWDINLLLEMGVKGLETEVDRSRFEDEHGKDYQVIDHFMIYAVK